MQWGSAPAWSGPLYASGLPGSGSLQTFVNYRIADRLVQGYWRNNEGWLREVPIVNDVVQWGGAPAFSGPIPFDFPGSGALQAHGDYGVGNTLIQAVWRGNQGWTRNVPISNGIIQWGQRGPWGGPLSIGGLPGSGDMQAQDNFVINTTYWQVTWRSNVQYTRSAPIVNGAVQFGQASAWSATTANENLPGSGNIETQANYSLDWVSYANEAPPRGEIRVEESDLGEYNIFQAYAQPYTVDATGEAKACYLYGIPIPTGQCTSRKATSARIYFNTHYVTSNKSYLARHELGHIFGLYHQPCDEPASVMYEPSCGPEYTTLQADEIVWINNNY